MESLIQTRNGIECNYTAIKLQHKSMDHHYKRLKEIQKSTIKKKIRNSPTPKRVNAFNRIERDKEIEKSNQSLVNRIILITKRKSDIGNKTKSFTSLKSLNRHIRDKEAKRISHENEAIVQRIMNQRPFILKKKLDKEFEIYQKYCNRLSKRNYLNYNRQYSMYNELLIKKERSMTPSCDSSIKINYNLDFLTPKPKFNKNNYPKPYHSLCIQENSSIDLK